MDVGAFDPDTRVRFAAFGFLEHQTELRAEIVPYATLLAGFTLDGTRVPLLGPQGIFKPPILPEVRLGITTAPTAAHPLARRGARPVSGVWPVYIVATRRSGAPPRLPNTGRE